MSQQPATNPVVEFYNKWSEKTPYVTRTVTIVMVVEYILSWLFPIEDYLGNETRYSLLHFEIYRLILSPIVGNSLIMMVLVFMSFPFMGAKMEWSMGSSSFASLLGTIALATNILFSLCCLLLWSVGTNALGWKCQGFWTVLFALITIECLQVPDQPRRMFFIPVDIPSKYMPLAMFALFTLISGPQLSFLISMGVGYLQHLGHLDRFRPPSATLQSLEGPDGTLHQVSQSRGWVLAQTQNDTWIPVNTRDDMWGSQQGQGMDNSSRGGGSSHGAVQGAGAKGNIHTAGDYSGVGGGGNSGHGGAAGGATAAPTHFPGSGSKLGGTSSGGGVTSMFSGSSHGSGSAAPSREEIAARRLQALQQQQMSGGGGGGPNAV